MMVKKMDALGGFSGFAFAKMINAVFSGEDAFFDFLFAIVEGAWTHALQEFWSVVLEHFNEMVESRKNAVIFFWSESFWLFWLFWFLFFVVVKKVSAVLEGFTFTAKLVDAIHEVMRNILAILDQFSTVCSCVFLTDTFNEIDAIMTEKIEDVLEISENIKKTVMMISGRGGSGDQGGQSKIGEN